MYTNLKPFSLMGLPNKISSSEKDLHATITKRDFFDNRLKNKQDTLLLISEAAKSVVPVAAWEGEEEGGCTTPKAADEGGSDLPKCPPPPPRKPKSVPLEKKRKSERVFLDLSTEIESLFPSNILRDFRCGKIKKVRTDQCPKTL